jgi:hypothetical protein
VAGTLVRSLEAVRQAELVVRTWPFPAAPLVEASTFESLGNPASFLSRHNRAGSKITMPRDEPATAEPGLDCWWKQGQPSSDPSPRNPLLAQRLGESLLQDVARALDAARNRSEHHLVCTVTATVKIFQLGLQTTHVHKGGCAS